MTKKYIVNENYSNETEYNTLWDLWHGKDHFTTGMTGNDKSEMMVLSGLSFDDPIETMMKDREDLPDDLQQFLQGTPASAIGGRPFDVESVATEHAWQCDECGKTFPDAKGATQHEKETGHHDMGFAMGLSGDTKFDKLGEALDPKTTDITICVVCGRDIDSHSNPNTDYRGMKGDAPPTDHYFSGGDQGGSDDKYDFESYSKEEQEEQLPKGRTPQTPGEWDLYHASIEPDPNVDYTEEGGPGSGPTGKGYAPEPEQVARVGDPHYDPYKATPPSERLQTDPELSRMTENDDEKDEIDAQVNRDKYKADPDNEDRDAYEGGFDASSKYGSKQNPKGWLFNPKEESDEGGQGSGPTGKPPEPWGDSPEDKDNWGGRYSKKDDDEWRERQGYEGIINILNEADFQEDEHPRADDGKFSSGGGNGGKHSDKSEKDLVKAIKGGSKEWKDWGRNEKTEELYAEIEKRNKDVPIPSGKYPKVFRDDPDAVSKMEQKIKVIEDQQEYWKKIIKFPSRDYKNHQQLGDAKWYEMSLTSTKLRDAKKKLEGIKAQQERGTTLTRKPTYQGGRKNFYYSEEPKGESRAKEFKPELQGKKIRITGGDHAGEIAVVTSVEIYGDSVQVDLEGNRYYNIPEGQYEVLGEARAKEVLVSWDVDGSTTQTNADAQFAALIPIFNGVMKASFRSTEDGSFTFAADFEKERDAKEWADNLQSMGDIGVKNISVESYAKEAVPSAKDYWEEEGWKEQDFPWGGKPATNYSSNWNTLNDTEQQDITDRFNAMVDEDPSIFEAVQPKENKYSLTSEPELDTTVVESKSVCLDCKRKGKSFVTDDYDPGDKIPKHIQWHKEKEGNDYEPDFGSESRANENCKQCEKEFGRITDDHTTKSHLEDNLQGMLEVYTREDYNHGKTAFRDEVEGDITRLEQEIRDAGNESRAKEFEGGPEDYLDIGIDRWTGEPKEFDWKEDIDLMSKQELIDHIDISLPAEEYDYAVALLDSKFGGESKAKETEDWKPHRDVDYGRNKPVKLEDEESVDDPEDIAILDRLLENEEEEQEKGDDEEEDIALIAQLLDPEADESYAKEFESPIRDMAGNPYPTPEGDADCTFCGKKFDNWDVLGDHITIVHNDQGRTREFYGGNAPQSILNHPDWTGYAGESYAKEIGGTDYTRTVDIWGTLGDQQRKDIIEMAGIETGTLKPEWSDDLIQKYDLSHLFDNGRLDDIEKKYYADRDYEEKINDMARGGFYEIEGALHTSIIKRLGQIGESKKKADEDNLWQSQGKQLNCPVCGIDFNSGRDMGDHLIVEHQWEESDFEQFEEGRAQENYEGSECNICGLDKDEHNESTGHEFTPAIIQEAERKVSPNSLLRDTEPLALPTGKNALDQTYGTSEPETEDGQDLTGKTLRRKGN